MEHVPTTVESQEGLKPTGFVQAEAESLRFWVESQEGLKRNIDHRRRGCGDSGG